MTVNVSLCGAIPRSELLSCPNRGLSSRMACGAQLATIPTTTEQVISAAASTLRQRNFNKLILPQASMIEPPSWVVPAKGESRLEPVGESRHLQSTVDLTKKACILFGRSHNSDVQLLHCTSSRKHALLFHHPNGSCYVVDCGSAHGTYINGKRVQTFAQEGSGTVQPHKVKKGALVRFGGPGAPSYILKSFSVGFETFVRNLEMAETLVCKRMAEVDGSPTTCFVKQEIFPKKGCISELSFESLAKLNTRLNSSVSVSSDIVALAASRLSQLRRDSGKTQFPPRRKRSFELESMNIEPVLKKRRSNSRESIGSSAVDVSELSIISPDRGRSCSPIPELHGVVNRPVVSPNPLEIEHSRETSLGLKNILSLKLPLSILKKEVQFSDEPPECFYPSSITPDSSDSEER